MRRNYLSKHCQDIVANLLIVKWQQSISHADWFTAVQYTFGTNLPSIIHCRLWNCCTFIFLSIWLHLCLLSPSSPISLLRSLSPSSLSFPIYISVLCSISSESIPPTPSLCFSILLISLFLPSLLPSLIHSSVSN